LTATVRAECGHEQNCLPLRPKPREHPLVSIACVAKGRSGVKRVSDNGFLAALALVALLTAGCGRIGIELYPEDAGGGDDDGGSADDGGDDLDADQGGDDASDADNVGPTVDGCVLSPLGACKTCEVDAGFVGDKSCGVGYCRTTNTPSHCEDGIEIACVPGNQRADSDVTCDGIDDDCSGSADEDYLGSMTNCGAGVCARSGMLMCTAGSADDMCTPGAPTATLDDATGNGNGLDDDCDGRIDEDVSSCDTTPRVFEAGVSMNIAVPMGCGSATVQLWGGAGAAGGQAGISAAIMQGGRGGSGGYARNMLTLSGPLTLYIGNGGAANCGAGGSNPGAATYSGGKSGSGNGSPGADGMVAGGGAGAMNTVGFSGGRGYYGGGGGGESSFDPANGPASDGGGGGAASVALLNGVRVMVAGGGGGGGGAAPLVYNFAESGGNGGEGCAGAGTAGASARTGGGGGGGVCMGTTVSVGTNGMPANAASVPAPRARGTNADCAAGGNGYAIVTFAR
jgi:hypothetical protein